MKTNATLNTLQSVNDRPWWQVRPILTGALMVACAGFGALWLEADLRAELFATLVKPLAETLAAAARSDLGVALALATVAGLLIGWGLRRERSQPLSTDAVQTA